MRRQGEQSVCNSGALKSNNQQYGRIEQVRIDKDNTAETVPVFIKFTSQMSALRAVNALDGRIFNGNKITARYFDSAKFTNGHLEVVVPKDEAEPQEGDILQQ